MLLAQVDWIIVKEVVSIIAQVLTLAILTFGTAWGIYIAFRTRALEVEQKKQGRRSNRKFKELATETQGQTKMLHDTQRVADDVKKQMDKVEHNTNNMREQMVSDAHGKGLNEGAAQEVGKHGAARDAAKEIGKAVAEQLAETELSVTATDPLPVEIQKPSK